DDDYGELAGEDEYELDELIEQTVELQCWLREPGAARPVRISLSISDHEVSATTPSHALTPYESQYEGYMGNYGNTIDRWYRRAAVVLWPKAMAFAVRAQADPAWALSQISRRLRASDTAVAQELVASLEPFWATAARAVQSPRFVGAALRVAGSLDDGELARMLLAPLQIEALAPGHAAALAGFVQRHGERLLAGLLETWAQRPRWHAGPADRAGWVTALPRLCEALVTRGSSGEAAGVALVTASLHWLTAAMRGALGDRAPSRRSQALGELAGPLTAVLHSAALLGAVKLRDEAIGFCTAQGDELVPCLVQALRAGAALARQMRRDSGLDQLADHCLGRLAVILDRPPRAGGDWSMQPPGDCGCELCAVLSKFLSDRTERTLEWPLAEQRRRHVHTIIDAAELPVSHRTRRQGRPYTLVLTKTDALHETERRERAARRADARWLVAHTVQDTAPSDSLVLH
ncbi:MAG: 2OG-Fe(II) oxygenase, partial [Solirubrobacteraceae bacterium]